MDRDRFDRGQLVEAAIALTGEDDFGEDTWQEGLDILLSSMAEEGRLSDVGVEVAITDVGGHLANRLLLTAWRRDHPEVAQGSVERPIVIVGQPRTGTTILFDLLAQDPAVRAPLTWEVDHPVPPPEAETYQSDERIGEVQGSIDMAESLMPGFTTFHPMGAQLGQECIRMTGGDFRSMIFPTQYRLPTYNHWLLYEADLAPAYRWHRQYLQHLQSRYPVEQWLLKSPAHLWHLEALVGEYPDAIIVQTHRDPLKVIASTSALAAHLRGLASDETSIPEAAAQYADDIFLGLDRGMEARDQGIVRADQVIDVQFSGFIADPFSTIKQIYAAMDRELTVSAEEKMRRFLADHPGDGDGSTTRYKFANTGLDADELRHRAAPYQARFGVASESVR